MGLCFGCFDGGNKRMTKEEERLASEEARARAAEAAQRRQGESEDSTGRAAGAGAEVEAEQQGMEKQTSNPDKGEQDLKD